MKLLITTQVVDYDDPILGFFHNWIIELAKSAESIEVICLKEGRHHLPENVRVHSLLKERGRPKFIPRIIYSIRFIKYAWRLRNKYDEVFVHMNEEYIVLGGLIWRFLGKRITLWRNFKTGSYMTPIACRLAQKVCYTSPDSFTSRYKNTVQMPIGVDTHLFKPSDTKLASNTILFFGRLDEIKRPDIFLSALQILAAKKIGYEAHIYGDPTTDNEKYAEDLKSQYKNIPNIYFHAGVSNKEAAEIYKKHAIYVNLTPSGSFDKTIGEAMASGCLVITGNNAVKEIMPAELFVDEETGENVVRALEKALSLSENERAQITKKQRAFIEEKHSLSLLAKKLFAKNKIKVALCINNLGMGGAERVVAELAERLDPNYFECSVITLFKNPDKNFLGEIPSSCSVKQFSFSGFLDLHSLRELYRFLKETKPDILHLHLPNTVFIVGCIAAVLRIPFIIHEHQIHTFHSWKIRLMYALIRPFSALTICYSEKVERGIFASTHLLTAPPEFLKNHSYTVRNGVDISAIKNIREKLDIHTKRNELDFKDDDIIVTSAARFIEWKGQRLLIEAFAEMASRVPKMKICFCGDGALLPELQQRAKDLGLEDRIIFLGSRHDVLEILVASDVSSLVFSYQQGVDLDPFGIAGIEAMACGTPLIIGLYEDSDCLEECQRIGIVVEPRNISALASVLVRLGRDPILRKEIGEIGAQYVAEFFNWDTILPIYETLYRLIT